MRICVYAASSAHCEAVYQSAARHLGFLLAEAGATIVYGGGGTGLMGAVADGALDAGGHVIGIIPRFMTEVEWQHPGIANLEVVEDMRERKHRLLTGSDAVVALPGGCGTLEELFEAITLKRLALYFNPIVLLNTKDFYAPLQRFMEQVIGERFMNAEHGDMWSLVDTPEQVLPRIRATPRWHDDARRFAAVRG
ncbi:MAG TPA: TIGR00730 family Rossman fold protein [Pseudomonadota bacterium]|nr:TIGR00730 family Rossman fold protein [Pseudomonadota bacterium]HQX25315.1 TIGR00730 family Rossman fold protein [Pseudomonadota bacterium]HQY36011.1 TIGR00730 family Rossman fold protein [Pseudomonadota bacterium]HRA36988.1 TIGR00730 family Rossman fold protein [Pseudomonadota bacterium]